MHIAFLDRDSTSARLGGSAVGLDFALSGRECDIEIRRVVDAAVLSWPTGDERRSETLGGNRDYVGLSVPTWPTIRCMIDEERAKTAELGRSPDPETAHGVHEENCLDGGFLLGFDLGTNAASGALRAALCLPFYSCNGGAFGGVHNEVHPLVAAFCRPRVVPILMDAAIASGIGIVNARDGAIVVYGRSVDAMIDFAQALHSRRGEIGRLRREPRRTSEPSAQRDLFERPEVRGRSPRRRN